MIKVIFLFFGLGLLLALPQGLAAKGKPDRGGTDTGHVSMTATGEGSDPKNFVVDAFQDCEEKLASNDTSYLCNKKGTNHDIMLGDFLMNHGYPNGSSAANCFGIGFFTVNIGVDLNKNGSAETVLRFNGFKNDGVTDVLYVLRVNDPRGWSGAFPPTAGVENTTTMGKLNGQTIISWTLGATNKSQARNACVDSGTFGPSGSDFIRVDFTRID
jgi:hypothetical protein